MNDALEIHWGYSIWENVANEIYNEVGEEFLNEIDEILHSFGIYGLLTAACFSKNGDVLSQWRAYADDGKGYAIGFKATELLKLPIRGLNVLYDRNKQIKELKKIILAIHEVEKNEVKKYSSDFKTLCFTLACDLAAYKNPAFAEELEVRLLHVLDFEKSNKFLKLVDQGGTAFGKVKKGEIVKFNMKENIPVAFIDEDFTDNGKNNPIVEVIIGPKNNVRVTAISVYLETIGLGNIDVKKSKASYR